MNFPILFYPSVGGIGNVMDTRLMSEDRIIYGSFYEIKSFPLEEFFRLKNVQLS